MFPGCVRALERLESQLAAENISRYVREHPREGSNRLLYKIDKLGPQFEEQAIKKLFERYSAAFADWL